MFGSSPIGCNYVDFMNSSCWMKSSCKLNFCETSFLMRFQYLFIIFYYISTSQFLRFLIHFWFLAFDQSKSPLTKRRCTKGPPGLVAFDSGPETSEVDGSDAWLKWNERYIFQMIQRSSDIRCGIFMYILLDTIHVIFIDIYWIWYWIKPVNIQWLSDVPLNLRYEAPRGACFIISPNCELPTKGTNTSVKGERFGARNVVYHPYYKHQASFRSSSELPNFFQQLVASCLEKELENWMHLPSSVRRMSSQIICICFLTCLLISCYPSFIFMPVKSEAHTESMSLYLITYIYILYSRYIYYTYIYALQLCNNMCVIHLPQLRVDQGRRNWWIGVKAVTSLRSSALVCGGWSCWHLPLKR